MAFIEIFCRLLEDLIKNPQKLLSSIIQNKNSRRTRRVKLYYLRILIFDSCIWKAVLTERHWVSLEAAKVVDKKKWGTPSWHFLLFLYAIRKEIRNRSSILCQIFKEFGKLHETFTNKSKHQLIDFKIYSAKNSLQLYVSYHQPTLPYILRLIMLFIISGCGIRNS